MGQGTSDGERNAAGEGSTIGEESVEELSDSGRDTVQDEYLSRNQDMRRLLQLQENESMVKKELAGDGVKAELEAGLGTVVGRLMAPYNHYSGVTLGSLWFSPFHCRPRRDHVVEVLLPAAGAAPRLKDQSQALATGSAVEAGVRAHGAGQDGQLERLNETKLLDELAEVGSEEELATEFVVERFVVRESGPKCEEASAEIPKLCRGQRGHRRFIANPRLVG